MAQKCTPGDALHHADGSHRTTPPSTRGRRLSLHERQLQRHLARLALPVAAALLVLTGCSADEPEPESADVMTPVEAAEQEPNLSPAAARDLLRQMQPSMASATDDQLDELAEITCDAFDGGATPEQMVMAVDDGLGAEAGAVMAFAVFGYCPEHQPIIDEFMEEN